MSNTLKLVIVGIITVAATFLFTIPYYRKLWRKMDEKPRVDTIYKVYGGPHTFTNCQVEYYDISHLPPEIQAEMHRVFGKMMRPKLLQDSAAPLRPLIHGDTIIVLHGQRLKRRYAK